MQTPTEPQRDLPDTVVHLGLAGLLPFVALGLGAWWVGDAWRVQLQSAQLVYAAVVLSFIGAMHWGLGLAARRTEPLPYVWGVLPSVLGWLAAIAPPVVGAPLASISLIVCWVVDRRLIRGWPFAASYLRLRLRLTVVAWVAMVLGRLAN